MTVRTFLLGSLAAFVAGGVSVTLVVTQLKPDAAGWLGVTLLLLGLFVAVAGLASLVGYVLRRVLVRQQFPVYAVRTSLRQSILVASFLTILLLLQLGRLYQWWVAIVLLVILVLLELAFLRSQSRSRVSGRPAGRASREARRSTGEEA